MTQPIHTCHQMAKQASTPTLVAGDPTQRPYSQKKSPVNNPVNDTDSTDKLLSPDQKFELLSAYIDSEVSEEERQLVEGWLVSDPQMQKQYETQLKLSQAMKSFLSM
ncbi:MAG: anti-sigma factor [Phormidesmis sp.]